MGPLLLQQNGFSLVLVFLPPRAKMVCLLFWFSLNMGRSFLVSTIAFRLSGLPRLWLPRPSKSQPACWQPILILACRRLTLRSNPCKERAGGNLFGPVNELKLTEKRRTVTEGAVCPTQSVVQVEGIFRHPQDRGFLSDAICLRLRAFFLERGRDFSSDFGFRPFFSRATF